MKNITTLAIVGLLSLTVSASVSATASASAQQTNSAQAQAPSARIEQVQLKNGPLADFYELVSQRGNTAEELAQTKLKEEAQTLASLKKLELDKQAKGKKELDKLPQHSAK